MFIVWISGKMALKPRKSEILAMQHQLRDESLDTLAATDGSGSLKELSVHLYVGVE